MFARPVMRRILHVAGTAAVFAGLLAGSASAQTLWDWGGGNVVGGSGRQIVRFSPQYKPGQLVVSFGDRQLYYVTRPGEAISYPIAIPREQSRWQGGMTVTQKRVNPSWTPTAEVRAENPRLPSWVPGGHPMNPLGVRALYLGTSTYRIHGTDAPWTIGQPVSKGCIRMYNQDVVHLYERVPIGAHVTVTWQRFEGRDAVASAGYGYGALFDDSNVSRSKRTAARLADGDDVPARTTRALRSADGSSTSGERRTEKPKPQSAGRQSAREESSETGVARFSSAAATAAEAEAGEPKRQQLPKRVA